MKNRKEKIEIKTVRNCNLNGSVSNLHRVRCFTSNGTLVNEVFEDINEARIFMLDKACELINNGYDVTVIPYTN